MPPQNHTQYEPPWAFKLPPVKEIRVQRSLVCLENLILFQGGGVYSIFICLSLLSRPVTTPPREYTSLFREDRPLIQQLSLRTLLKVVHNYLPVRSGSILAFSGRF